MTCSLEAFAVGQEEAWAITRKGRFVFKVFQELERRVSNQLPEGVDIYTVTDSSGTRLVDHEKECEIFDSKPVLFPSVKLCTCGKGRQQHD